MTKKSDEMKDEIFKTKGESINGKNLSRNTLLSMKCISGINT